MSFQREVVSPLVLAKLAACYAVISPTREVAPPSCTGHFGFMGSWPLPLVFASLAYNFPLSFSIACLLAPFCTRRVGRMEILPLFCFHRPGGMLVRLLVDFFPTHQSSTFAHFSPYSSFFFVITIHNNMCQLVAVVPISARIWKLSFDFNKCVFSPIWPPGRGLAASD